MSKIININTRSALTANAADPSSNGFTSSGVTRLAGAIKQARVRNRIRNVTGSFQAVPQLQWWNNPDDSGESPTTTDIGSFGSSTGPQAPSAWTGVSSTADDHQVVYLGWDTRNSSGTALSSAELITEWELELYESQQFVELMWRQFVANSTSQVFYPITDWLDANEAEAVRAILELQGAAGDFEVQMGYQLTNNTGAGGSATSFGSAITADGLHFPSGLAAPSIDQKLYIRFGYLVRVTSAGTGIGAVWSKVEMLRG